MDRSEENPMVSLDVKVQDPPIRRLFPVLLDIASLMLKKINVSIVGDLALRAYGLDQEVGNTVQVAVRDAHMEKAKHQLLSQGYVEEDLSPDTESIYTYQMSSIRSAVLRTAAGVYRGRAVATRHYATRGIDEHAKKMIAICPPEIKASLRSADRFMAKYFPCPNKTRDWGSYVCAQAARVYLNEISFKEAERRLPRVDSVIQALAESIPKRPRQRKVWKKIHLTTDGDKDKNETSVITSIEPRSSVNPKHRIVYRLRRVVDRINRERQMQGTNANSPVII
ncbi:hypothetical protein KEM56_007486 [Ascosphaera pollenicola]|nr:hypothetical protein KEM56_007486 [Ascosphaera pollenicola]